MAAPVDSLDAPGRGPIWLKPVCWGVMRVGVRGALPLPDAADVAAMPLYLRAVDRQRQRTKKQHRRREWVKKGKERKEEEEQTHRYFINTSKHSLPPGAA